MGKGLIPGGLDPFGHRVRPFHVEDEHTVFEWCMICTDRHPTAFLGDDSRTATARLQDTRLILLGARNSNEPGWRPHPTETDKGVWDDHATYRRCNAVYQELAESIMIGRLEALRVYLDDRPGELDPTLCIIGTDPVLTIARRRGDFSQYIAALLERANTAAVAVADRRAEATPAETSSIEQLAEWIFARHESWNTFEKLYDAARTDTETGALRKRDFLTAYQRVYATASHRPPASGWPLKSPYRERWKAKD
jgi:hypothetical protein